MNRSILVTGVAGSGKSFLCKELKRRGYKAYDIEEIDGMFSMVDKKTRKVAERYDNKFLEDAKNHDWVCDEKKLSCLIMKNPKGVVFYCGVASNLDDLLHLFYRVFLLKASPETTRSRLSTRTSNNFGRTREVQEWVLSWKGWWEDHITEKGAIVIDSNRTIKQVADEILKNILS
jgi:dephospho-CoA kinase